MKKAIRLCLFLLTALPSAGWAYDVQLKPDAMEREMDSKAPSMDFKTYQKNLDDLFYITMTTNPDPNYGVHAAIIDLTRRRTQNPKDPEPLIALGHIYRILGQPADANRFYRRAIRLKQDNYYLYLFSGMMYFQMKKYPQALKQIEHAIRINPHDVYAWLARGRTAREAGQEMLAMESYRKAHEAAPSNGEATFMLSAYELKKGNNAEALRLFEDLYQKKPKDENTQYQLGALYLMNNQPQRTLNLWENLFYQGNRNPEFVFSLALAYVQTEKYEQAEHLLAPLAFIYPRDPGIAFMMGEVYRKEGRLDDAVRALRALLAEYPGYMNAYQGLVLALLDKKDIDAARTVLKDASTRIADPLLLEQLSTAINTNPAALTEEHVHTTPQKK